MRTIRRSANSAKEGTATRNASGAKDYMKEMGKNDIHSRLWIVFVKFFFGCIFDSSYKKTTTYYIQSMIVIVMAFIIITTR